MIVSALICGVVFTGCDSDKAELTSDMEIEGIFTGKQRVTYFYGWRSSLLRIITIELKNGKYSCIGFLHDQAEFSGNYSINDDKIIFEIEVWKTDYIYNGNVIALNFDTHIIPQGEYNYTFDGKKLKFSKTYDDIGHYEYELERE